MQKVSTATVKIEENISLKPLSNYRIGGAARFFSEARTVEEIKSAVLFAREQLLEFFVLGGGTNLLIDDRGFDGLVLKPTIVTLQADNTVVTAGAGVLVSELLEFSIEHGLSGLEWAGGLPGTVGGAIRGNAGAFRGEIKDCIIEVDSFDIRNLQAVNRQNKDCQFGYRTSLFKEQNGQEIILGASLKLETGDREKIGAAIQEKIDYRRERHPMNYPNIGSTFKNVDWKQVPQKFQPALGKVVKEDPFPVVPTAYLLSEAGLKGVRRGGAIISPKHPNFIVNVLNATAADVKELIGIAKQEVFKKFEIRLEEEIQLV